MGRKLPITSKRKQTMKNINFRLLTIKVSMIVIVAVSVLIPKIAIGLEITASSLALTDVQAAVDQVAAAGGGTVYLPEGTSDWWTDGLFMPGGVNLIGQGVDKTTIRWNFDNGNGILINERWDQRDVNKYVPFRISGINLIGTYNGNAIYSIIDIRFAKNFRIDHNILEGARYFINAGSDVEKPSTGVIDHNIIKRGSSNYMYGYGVSVGAREYIDNKPFGTDDAIFIEDNTIEEMSHPVGSFGGSHYVFRYNTVNDMVTDDCGGIDAHGPGFVYFDGVTRGAAVWEIYNNTITATTNFNPLCWTSMRLRAGKGVIFNNTINNYRHMVNFTVDTYSCDNNGLDHVNGVYIWNNTLQNVSEEPIYIEPDACTQQYVRMNQEIFESPFVGYTPYTYPHPLTTSGGGGGGDTGGNTSSGGDASASGGGGCGFVKDNNSNRVSKGQSGRAADIGLMVMLFLLLFLLKLRKRRKYFVASLTKKNISTNAINLVT